jgi:hypothetical protein
VCGAWRALVDGHRLLRADLLPLSLADLFICNNDLEYPELFVRPSAADFADYTINGYVEDQCNGLLLYDDCVLNPATGGLLRLPERPPPRAGMEHFLKYEQLAFDPAVSCDYEVFSIPTVSRFRTISTTWRRL